jgi:hypothetical protein
VFGGGIGPPGHGEGSASPAARGDNAGRQNCARGSNTIRGGDDFLKASEALSGSPVSYGARGDKTIHLPSQPYWAKGVSVEVGYGGDSIAASARLRFMSRHRLFGAQGHALPTRDGCSCPEHGQHNRAPISGRSAGFKGAPGKLCGSLDAAAAWGRSHKHRLWDLWANKREIRNRSPSGGDELIESGKSTILSTYRKQVGGYQVENTRLPERTMALPM